MKKDKGRDWFSLFRIVAMAGLTISVSASAKDIRSAVSAGQMAPPFQARALDGQLINFPADYKGKVVLLDFWATWCPPCRAELPNVVATYQEFHQYGFDAVSVSLDQPRRGPALLQFIQAHHMTWPQIYDGRYWKAAIALKYGIKAIPCPVLVDGDTGKIIAQGPDAVGDDLPLWVGKTLVSKGRKLPGYGVYDPTAPDKITVIINGQKITLWRTGQLKEAEKVAAAGDKPIAWISSDWKLLDGAGTISRADSRGATLHAIYALRDRTVLVFEDAYVENNKIPPMLDRALHMPNPHYMPPSIIFLNPSATKVLAKVPYEPEFVKRAHSLANCLGEAEAKMEPPAKAQK